MSNSQSPQSKRGGGQDYGQFQKGSVPSSTFRAPTRDDEVNADSWQHQGETVSETYKPKV